VHYRLDPVDRGLDPGALPEVAGDVLDPGLLRCPGASGQDPKFVSGFAKQWCDVSAESPHTAGEQDGWAHGLVLPGVPRRTTARTKGSGEAPAWQRIAGARVDGVEVGFTGWLGLLRALEKLIGRDEPVAPGE
jgi:hypothetical protein